MLATNLELQHSIWQHKKLTRIENKLVDPIIPEPVLGHVPGNTLLCLCQTPISNHPGSGGSKKLLLISWKYTWSYYTRASHRSVMCQALLSCISLPDPISDHPISPGMSGSKKCLYAWKEIKSHFTRTSQFYFMFQALLSFISLIPPNQIIPSDQDWAGKKFLTYLKSY